MNLRKHKLIASLVVLSMAIGQPAVFAEGQTHNLAADVDNFFRQISFQEERIELNQKHGIKIAPYYSQIWKLTDNVFNSPSGGNETFEMIHTFKPGVRVTHVGDYGNAGVNYNAAISLYHHHGKQNEQDQFFTSWINHKPSENTYIKLSETLNQQSGVGAIESAEPTNWLDNTLVVLGGYHINENTEATLGYRMFDRDFSSTPAKHFNYNEDIYSATIQHNLESYHDELGGFRGIASLRLGNVEYSKSHNRDAFWIEVPVGVSGKIPGDVQMNATVGIYGRNQENEHRNDMHWITTNVSLSKVFDKKTKVEASFRRFPQEATYGGAAVSDNKRWAFDVKHIASKKLRFRGNLAWTNMDIEQSSFTGSRVLVAGLLIFIPPNRVKRNDDVLSVNLGSDLKVSQTVTLHADYTYRRRDSNVSALDMTENSAVFRASVAV